MNVIKLVQRLASCLVDVETAFLHRVLGEGEEVYMDCPEGLDHEDNECLLLLKTLYRLKQSARAFFLTFTKVMMEARFQPSKIDPCLFVKHDPTVTVCAVVWVDDCLFVGDKAAIERTTVELEKSFKPKVKWNVKDHLSCDCTFNAEEQRAWIGQPHVHKKLEQCFGGMAPDKTFATPGTPRHQLVRPFGDLDALSPQDQSVCGSGVGQLLCLTKHTRLDLANVVRELTKEMTKATGGAVKEMLRAIKFALHTWNLGLKLDPEPHCNDAFEQWDQHVNLNANWGADTELRKCCSLQGLPCHLEEQATISDGPIECRVQMLCIG